MLHGAGVAEEFVASRVWLQADLTDNYPGAEAGLAEFSWGNMDWTVPYAAHFPATDAQQWLLYVYFSCTSFANVTCIDQYPVTINAYYTFRVYHCGPLTGNGVCTEIYYAGAWRRLGPNNGRNDAERCVFDDGSGRCAPENMTEVYSADLTWPTFGPNAGLGHTNGQVQIGAAPGWIRWDQTQADTFLVLNAAPYCASYGTTQNYYWNFDTYHTGQQACTNP